MRPIDTLVRELRNPYGQLLTLRTKLGITGTDIRAKQLSREKKPAETFKFTETKSSDWFVYSESWVVKFSPVDKKLQDDPWYDVYKEYEILQGLRATPPPAVPAPDPLHRSTAAETEVVGTKFIIMSFVEGKSFENAKRIPEQYREIAFTSVMRTLASDVHNYNWTASTRQTRSETFWTKQETAWNKNYTVSSCAQNRYILLQQQSSITDTFFQRMSSAVKPSHSDSRVIHGDMNISNVIFDDLYNVKAIVDWKSLENGDPMVDVAYLCLTFMRPEDYGYRFRVLNNHQLLLGYANNMESRVLTVYQSCCNFRAGFNEKVFNFAKAVCCLRWLSILQAAKADNFVGHESGGYRDNTDHTQLVMDCLATAGESFYTQSL